MRTMHEILTPGILLSETHYPFLSEPGAIADAVARVAGEGFYGRVEIPPIASAADRRRIGRTVAGAGLSVTQWMSFVLVQENLSLASLDESTRQRAVRRLIDEFPAAAECGATGIAVLSGPDPGPASRSQAMEALCLSLCELHQALPTEPGTRLILEPLDREVHKKGLVGPTAEALSLVARVRDAGSDLWISWDAAHTTLCGEDVLDSLGAAEGCIEQMHMANAVLDRSHEAFGDCHGRIGKPGVLDVNGIAAIFDKALDVGIFGERRTSVAVEVRTPEGGDPWETERHGRAVLEAAWQISRQRKAFA